MEKKKKTNSCNKFNNNNYNFNFITGSRLDLNRYYSRNKTNISYNSLGKNILDVNYNPNKNLSPHNNSPNQNNYNSSGKNIPDINKKINEIRNEVIKK